ncbi:MULTISPECIES: MotA/TolQ/ExbB proton channel family protein [Gloeobacter]|uniref:Gll1141 protein n=2 Tax=Gloeobacter TaxID=33071 RepID=Q7NLI2_GLOVI|nr:MULTISPECIES: MotA/TolQ/ExbB proton channel family protein [Gloeobacter]UFP94945.1 MotA/TolQ/ExbB proton channel family protein [Gloeobacter morelensis MG652769]BAC89082.1 gll1141 [Gloeobacter violaceus PCC 7421]
MNLLADLYRFVVNDWWIAVPLLLCSVLTIAVVTERWLYINRNKTDVDRFIVRLQRELERANLSGARNLCEQVGGVIGEVAEDGVRLLSVPRVKFEQAFDITINLGMRKFEKHLNVLGTIGAVAPFIGLLGTVVGILRSFQTFAGEGATSNKLAAEIGFALIATAAGLIVAIASVVAYNIFQNIVAQFEDDFQLLKLLFLNFADTAEFEGEVVEESTIPQQ